MTADINDNLLEIEQDIANKAKIYAGMVLDTFHIERTEMNIASMRDFLTSFTVQIIKEHSDT